MQITVKSTTRESKQAQGKIYWGVKHDDGNWYNVITNDKPTMGARLDVEVKTTEYNGRTYRWATPTAKQQSAAPQSNGHITFEDYAAMAKAAHDIALEIEPDHTAEAYIDRSVARMAFVNTCLISFKDGKLSFPHEDPPPPADDDIPF